jgi:hypothetical protein
MRREGELARLVTAALIGWISEDGGDKWRQKRG